MILTSWHHPALFGHCPNPQEPWDSRSVCLLLSAVLTLTLLGSALKLQPLSDGQDPGCLVSDGLAHQPLRDLSDTWGNSGRKGLCSSPPKQLSGSSREAERHWLAKSTSVAWREGKLHELAIEKVGCHTHLQCRMSASYCSLTGKRSFVLYLNVDWGDMQTNFYQQGLLWE